MSRQAHHSIIFSDLHFGDTRCTLHSFHTSLRLFEYLDRFRPVSEIILLGDILDLQLANWAQAIEGRFLDGPKKRAVGFRYFINKLQEHTGASKLIYIPGNHDYKIFEYHSIDRHLIAPIRNGKKLSGRISFYREFADPFFRGMISNPEVNVRVIYPHMTLKVRNERILLTHGHMFDSSQAFWKDAGSAFDDQKVDSRVARHEYFKRVSLYQNVVSGVSTNKKMKEAFNRVYQPFTSINDRFRRKRSAMRLTTKMHTSIEQYLKYCCRSKNIAGVVFGHTHEPGSVSVPAAAPLRHVWNCGSFLKESEGSPNGSFITIRHDSRTSLDDAVQVHRI